MAYRKTESVLAEIEGRKERIVAAAIAVISKRGAGELTSASVSEKAKLSVGLIYRHFPDMNELRAHIFALLLARDLGVLREADDLGTAIRSWTRTLSLNPHLASALAADAAYRIGIKRELSKLIRATGADNPNTLAALVCGAVIEAARSMVPRDGAPLVAALLRAVGARARAGA